MAKSKSVLVPSHSCPMQQCNKSVSACNVGMSETCADIGANCYGGSVEKPPKGCSVQRKTPSAGQSPFTLPDVIKISSCHLNQSRIKSHSAVKTHKYCNHMGVDVVLQTLDSGKVIGAVSVLDCGCSHTCIDQKFVTQHGINVNKLSKPIPVTNADGTANAIGFITEYVVLRLQVGEHEELWNFFVSDLGAHLSSLDWTGSRCTILILIGEREGYHSPGVLLSAQTMILQSASVAWPFQSPTRISTRSLKRSLLMSCHHIDHGIM